MKAGWIQDTSKDDDWWMLELEPRVYAIIAQSTFDSSYCWQAVRGDYRIVDTEIGREAAAQRAEEALSLPIGEFNNRVAADLIEQLHRLEEKLFALNPKMKSSPGYQVGYADGMAACREKITQALEA